MLALQLIRKMSEGREHMKIICITHYNYCNALHIKETQQTCQLLDSHLKETSKIIQ